MHEPIKPETDIGNGKKRSPVPGRRGWPFRHVLALGGLAVLLVVGVVLAGTHQHLIAGTDALVGWIEGLGPLGALAIVGLMIVHCFVPFPAEILALCAGAAFGTVNGSVLIWIGAMIGAALSFGLARALGRSAVEALLPARQRGALDDWSADQGAITLLISRFIPVIAFNLINYAAGLTRVSWWTFLWSTGIGILPLTVLMVHMGAQMRELDLTTLFLVSAIGIAAIWLLHYSARRFGWLPKR